MSSLATRCSACGTVFRVVPDQLRVSEGWVRCGRCSQVFNALEALVDLETGLPRREGGFGPASGFEGSNGMPLDVAQPAARPGAPALPPSPPSAPTPALPALPNAADQLARDFASTSAPETRPPHTSELLSPAPPSVFGADAGDDSDPGGLRADPAHKPSFVRQADRAARWRRPGVRAALAGVALLASAGLAGQLPTPGATASPPGRRPWHRCWPRVASGSAANSARRARSMRCRSRARASCAWSAATSTSCRCRCATARRTRWPHRRSTSP
jgi:predicted Zn finger-like uncharacterized protein